MSLFHSLLGHYYNQRGRLWEKIVALHLRGRLPSNPNQKRIDLRVNGKGIQVKRGSWSTVREHFHKYPSTPVVFVPDAIPKKNGIISAFIFNLLERR